MNIIARKSNNWNIICSIIYVKCCSSCFYWCHIWNTWVIILINRNGRCYWYFRYYTTFYPREIEFYFTFNQSRDSRKLLKYFSGTTTSASNMLLFFGMPPINFVLHSKELRVTFVPVIYLIKRSIIFIGIIIYFISRIIPQTSWCHRTIFTIF